jgi:hypothetical protein
MKTFKRNWPFLLLFLVVALVVTTSSLLYGLHDTLCHYGLGYEGFFQGW